MSEQQKAAASKRRVSRRFVHGFFTGALLGNALALLVHIAWWLLHD
jgi:hypothetical protein